MEAAETLEARGQVFKTHTSLAQIGNLEGWGSGRQETALTGDLCAFCEDPVGLLQAVDRCPPAQQVAHAVSVAHGGRLVQRPLVVSIGGLDVHAPGLGQIG